ncbi:dolichol kinase-like isoform X2 [Apostichopus japonicus]|uniref:dolichol kinase-like isoform X2 n=1 Tax=Stichopus japonicus TaxID=307972 RepID=UPI003AB450FB
MSVLTCVFLLAIVLEMLITPEDITAVTNWKFRQKSSLGLITGALLIPMALVAHGNQQCGSNLMCYYQLPSLAVTVSLLITVSIGQNLLQRFRIWLSSALVLAGTFIVSFILMRFPQQFVEYAVFLIGGSVLGLSLLCHLMNSLPESFSLGEAMIISQGLTVLSLEVIKDFACPVTSSQKFGACLQVLVAGTINVGFLLRPVCNRIFQNQSIRTDKVNQHNKSTDLSWSGSIYFYLIFAGVNFFALFPWLGFQIKEFPVFYGLKFMFGSRDRVFLMTGWLVLVTLAIAVVGTTTSSSTVVRKYFHLIATGTFVSGLYYDPELICLASAGVFFIFIVLEVIRVLRVQPIGGSINDAFQVFVDDRDGGLLILTHVYLLVGLSLPIWILSGGHYLQSGKFLPLYSGVLSVGVGDTAASILGSQLGRYKWPETKKTMEGTLAAVVSQTVCCHLLQSYLGVVSQCHWLMIFASILLTSFLEAFTDQIDNLILPLFMFAILSVSNG